MVGWFRQAVQRPPAGAKKNTKKSVWLLFFFFFFFLFSLMFLFLVDPLVLANNWAETFGNRGEGEVYVKGNVGNRLFLKSYPQFTIKSRRVNFCVTPLVTRCYAKRKKLVDVE